MNYQAIDFEINETRYATIRLNRPEKRNAVSSQMVDEINAAIETAKQAEDLKCLLITGAGVESFCSGGDLNEMHGELTMDEAFQILYKMKEVLYKLTSFPLPTICLLNGEARGGGCEIATACDFRLAVENTQFGFVQGKLGITPGWGGGALLYEKVDPSHAFYWLSHGGMFEAETLKSWGWIHGIITSKEALEPETLLDPYISKSKELLETLKKQYLRKLSIYSLSAGMDEEVRGCARLWESMEHKQAVQDFKRKKQKNR